MGDQLYTEHMETEAYPHPYKGMLLLDKGTGRVLNALGAARAIVQAAPGDTCGSGISFKMSPNQLQSLNELVTEAAEKGMACCPCFRFDTVEETSLYYYLTLLSLRTDSEEYILLLLSSPQSPADAKSRLAQEKYALMGRMVSHLTHQILNPVQIIVGRLQLLMEEADGDDNIGSALNRIWQQTESIKTSLERFHSLFQPGIEERRPLNIGEVFDEVAFFYNYYGVRNQVELIRSMSTKSPPMTGKRNQLVLCFLSILLQLGEFALPGTSIAASSLPVSGKGGKNYLAIKFTVVYNYHRAEGTPFFHPGDTIDLNRFVSGFCMNIIKEHGGSAEIDSHRGGAIQLTVNLPYGC